MWQATYEFDCAPGIACPQLWRFVDSNQQVRIEKKYIKPGCMVLTLDRVIFVPYCKY